MTEQSPHGESKAPSKQPAKRSLKMFALNAGVAIAVTVVTCMFLMTPAEWVQAPRSTCKNNLKQIGMAFHSYHDDYGSFPTAYIADKTSQPMHSWRVLLLPYLGEKELYEAYDFEEPWNGRNNRKLAERIPRVFRCPSFEHHRSAEASDAHLTSYCAITGSGTAFAGSTPMSFSDVSDGALNTLLVAEVSAQQRPWMQPRDVTVANIHFQFSDEEADKLNHESGAQFLFVAGNVHFINHTIPPDLLTALTTIAGGEEIGDHWMRRIPDL
jgi:hypothetical protein